MRKYRSEFHQGSGYTRILGDEHFLQHTLAELARRMNRDASVLSQLLSKIRARMLMDMDFRQQLTQLKAGLQQ